MQEIFKILSDETRLRIIALLMNGEMCVCEIEKSLELTQSNASRHLTILKKSTILDNYKKSQWNYYSISNEFVTQNLKLWEYLEEKLKNLITFKNDYEKLKKCREFNICYKLIP